MKKVCLCVFLLALMLVSMPLAASAAENSKPVQLSLFNPVQIFDEDTSIDWFRFSLLYGYNKDVSGLDLGLVNRASGNVSGLQFGLVNMVGGDFTGWQDAAINFTDGDFVGLQTGIYNSTGKHAKGLQLGIVNVAGSLYGLQIGVLNINKAGSKYMKYLPVVNFAF